MKLQDLNIDTIIKNFEVLRKKQENNNLIIQHNDYGEWKDSKINDVNYDISEIRICTIDDTEMRIKPKPQYRPYSEVKEEWLGKKVVISSNTKAFIINGINFSNKKIIITDKWYSLIEMYAYYTWGKNGDANDGKPFGEVVE